MEQPRCSTCSHFDPRTHFCRYNPPVPMVFYENNGNRTTQTVSSKWVVITKPELDYCSFWRLDDEEDDGGGTSPPNG